MTAGTIVGGLLQLLLLGAVGWAVGNLVLDRATAGEKVAEIGVGERALAAVGGAILFSVALMAAHIVTGGAVFGVAGFVPVAALIVLVAARRRLTWGDAVPWGKLAAFGLLLATVYLVPALVGGSSIRTGDPPWHLGWTEQLLDGEPVPTGPAPELGRNAYPWGLHAVMATSVRLVPGSTPMVSLEMLHVALMMSIPLVAACLARRVRPDAGWAGAAAASLIGGFGWIVLDEPDFVTSPSHARYGADLVVASPNSVYELFPPALPRELGLVMLGAAAWLILAAARTRRTNLWVAAGAAVGLVGLLSVPLFVTAVLWMVAATVLVDRGARSRWLAAAGASAAAVFGLWAGPVLSNYLRHGGFVNITPQLGKEWPLPVALASWGLLLPLALVGLVVTLRAGRGRTLVGFTAASALLLAAAVARGRLDWDLAGNATLLHQGRMWPPAHLLGAVFAGVALVWAYERLKERSALLAPAAMGLLFAVAAASPVLASDRLTEIMRAGSAGFQYGVRDLAPGSFVRQATRYIDSSDVIEVRDGDDLGFLLFQLTGARLASYDDTRLEGNDLRIRYADLAAEYDERMAGEGFEPTYLVIPAPEGPYERALVRGRFGGREWILVQLSGGE